jgi:hypothetical protein
MVFSSEKTDASVVLRFETDPRVIEKDLLFLATDAN